MQDEQEEGNTHTRENKVLHPGDRHPGLAHVSDTVSLQARDSLRAIQFAIYVLPKRVSERVPRSEAQATWDGCRCHGSVQ